MSIIHKDIAAIREDYSKYSLEEQDVSADPIVQFQQWFQAALDAQVPEPTAMVLSTVSPQGQPSSRIVLLKDIKEQGLTFFTNYASRKGEEMAANAQVSILFFWPALQRQVRLEGCVSKVDAQESTDYFNSRPKDSRIGAIASPQSQVIASRTVLEEQVAALSAQYAQQQHVPRPQHWGGYFFTPSRVEFWQGRSSRLHDRIVYVEQDGQWTTQRLAP